MEAKYIHINDLCLCFGVFMANCALYTPLICANTPQHQPPPLILLLMVLSPLARLNSEYEIKFLLKPFFLEYKTNQLNMHKNITAHFAHFELI